MKAVRHFPVAEQYPSRTSMVSFFASKRISGMAIRGRKKPRSPKALRGETRLSVRDGGRHWSCCFIRVRSQVCPINIGPQLLTGNFAVGQSFNGRAPFGRNAFDCPLMNGLHGNLVASISDRLCPGDLDCFLDGVFHVKH